MSQTRREFLRTAGGLVVSLPFLHIPAFSMAQPHCIIVGAGLSGLAAAYALASKQWKVTVVEARGRIGGRVFTYQMPNSGGLTCELGGEWVGESHERMRELCGEFRIPLVEHRYKEALLSNGTVRQPGEWQYSPQAEEAFERLRNAYVKYTDDEKMAMDRLDWWTCLKGMGFPEEDLRLRDLFDSTDFGESIRMVSAYAAASEYFESSPYNEMDYIMKGGNSTLVNALADAIGRGNIRTSAAVQEIVQNERGENPVRVRVGDEWIEGNACICTVPASSLGGIKFSPALPVEHQEAARRLQYARIIKNQLPFSERFWGRENFSAVTDLDPHYLFHTTQSQPGPKGILTSYAIGDKADILAAQDDERRKNLIMEGILPFGESARQLSEGIVSYAWQRDAYTGGAYALYRPGDWYTIRPILQRPHGRIHFAGEHIADWQGFMEGAVVTGEEAAQNVMRQ